MAKKASKAATTTRTVYRDSKTGKFTNKATWTRSQAHGGTRYKRQRVEAAPPARKPPTAPPAAKKPPRRGAPPAPPLKRLPEPKRPIRPPKKPPARKPPARKKLPAGPQMWRVTVALPFPTSPERGPKKGHSVWKSGRTVYYGSTEREVRSMIQELKEQTLETVSAAVGYDPDDFWFSDKMDVAVDRIALEEEFLGITESRIEE